jgi:pimeloyl-ACP methyl ester carboxylesterase
MPPQLSLPNPEPVLFLHSSMSSKAQWRPFIAALGPGHLTIAPDLMGYGEHCDWQPSESFSLRHEAALVHGQAEKAAGGAAKMHIVGHSYGAAVAIQYAALFPSLVKSLTLYEPVCFGVADPNHEELSVVRSVWLRVARNIALKHPYEAARVFVDYWGGKGSFLAMNQDARDRMSVLVRKVPWDFRALFEADISTRTLAALDVPILIIHGGRTQGIVKHIAARLQAGAPRIRQLHIPNADHLSPMRAPALVMPAVTEFLTQRHAVEASIL